MRPVVYATGFFFAIILTSVFQHKLISELFQLVLISLIVIIPYPFSGLKFKLRGHV
jgi:hypothetical protein